MSLSINPFTFQALLKEEEQCLLLVPPNLNLQNSLASQQHLYNVVSRIKQAALRQYSLAHALPSTSITPNPLSSIQNLTTLGEQLHAWIEQKQDFLTMCFGILFYQEISHSLSIIPTSLPSHLSNIPSNLKKHHPKKRWKIQHVGDTEATKPKQTKTSIEEHSSHTSPEPLFQTANDENIQSDDDVLFVSTSYPKKPTTKILSQSSSNLYTSLTPSTGNTLELIRVEETLYMIQKTATNNMKKWAKKTHTIIEDLLESVELCVVPLNKTQQDLKALKLLPRKSQTYCTIKTFLTDTLPYLKNIKSPSEQKTATAMHHYLLDKTNEAISYM
ncbi:hypothetical protein CLAVI_000897 [Candidatus Clavichlamydia salmonicola]|uniref:hypothetical protein n=1 Tax=Candidatus Clavichlamydia salmonicola TaxID=469812 RepID=UPI001890F37E|nr:hypothetical protein [Candidatus Clavichlamydia salmonicola]MBF5051256.1 hypothetical protein [Candidatus Clavichlamydia salmonicola]